MNSYSLIYLFKKTKQLNLHDVFKKDFEFKLYKFFNDDKLLKAKQIKLLLTKFKGWF